MAVRRKTLPSRRALRRFDFLASECPNSTARACNHALRVERHLAAVRMRRAPPPAGHRGSAARPGCGVRVVPPGCAEPQMCPGRPTSWRSQPPSRPAVPEEGRLRRPAGPEGSRLFPGRRSSSEAATRRSAVGGWCPPCP